MMDEKLKYSLLRNELTIENQCKWSRYERCVWLVTLSIGTCMLYSTRAALPLIMSSVALEAKWNKSDIGAILGSYFWGYTLTQIIGGYLSNRFGGQRILLYATIGWTIITILTPNIIWYGLKLKNYGIPFIVTIRIINGALQGFHFPSVINLTSQNLSSTERANFLSLLISTSAIGIILTGTLGSFILDYCGWSYVFQAIGFLALSWLLSLRYYTMTNEKNRIINVSQLCCNKSPMNTVPWLRYFVRLSFWTCLLTHGCEMNCFFVLLSWLPTYFHDNFPHAKDWIVNTVPWLALPPGAFTAKYITNRLLAKDWSVTNVRKIIQSCCFASQNLALIIMSKTTDFNTSLICMTIIIGGVGFHNCAVMVNPQDLAPSHFDSIFGLMNTIGAISGFLSVYLTGYILEVTLNWGVVLNAVAIVNLVGWMLFLFFGSAEIIVQ